MTEPLDPAYPLFCAASDAEDEEHLDEAMRLYEKAARMGYSPAMTNLGNLYDDQNRPLQAIYWYIMAVRDGDAIGARNLAMHYVPRANRRWFRFWIKKAAEMGDEDAIREQAKLVANPDYITSLPWVDPEGED